MTCALGRAWGRTFSQKSDVSLNKQLVSGSFDAWGRTVFSKNVFFCTRDLSGAASLPGAELLPEIDFVLKKPLVWGSFAAVPGADLFFLQKIDFLC